jgi:RNA polymerase sigma-70 factor (ECF subfamily)
VKKRNSENDEPLIEACLKRDTPSWGMFVKKYSSLVSISIMSRLKRHGLCLPPQEIEEIRQDVFASIWKEESLRTVRNRKDISYWLSIVSGNAAIEHTRSLRSSEPAKKFLFLDEMDEEVLSKIALPSAARQRKEIDLKEIGKRIEEAIKRLPEKERLILRLNILYGKKQNEISDMLKLPLGTVSSYIKRAKEKLKLELGDLRED